MIGTTGKGGQYTAEVLEAISSYQEVSEPLQTFLTSAINIIPEDVHMDSFDLTSLSCYEENPKPKQMAMAQCGFVRQMCWVFRTSFREGIIQEILEYLVNFEEAIYRDNGN